MLPHFFRLSKKQPHPACFQRGGTQSTSVAWLMMQKIRHTLADMPMPRLSGIVQVDEKYVREAQKGSRSLVSYLDPTQSSRARKHNYRSECGIFGPEFVNVLCAVDEYGH